MPYLSEPSQNPLNLHVTLNNYLIFIEINSNSIKFFFLSITSFLKKILL